MYKVAFETFGCRLNQAETASLQAQFRARGYEVTEDPGDCDLYVVNTCSLTSQATSKCRRKLRSVIRKNPDACVAAIGCYAQTDADHLRTIPGIDYIVGTADKLRLAEIIPEPVKLTEPQVVARRVERETFTIAEAGYYIGSTRANIKVQEGCDFVCAFCIIPRSRGRARSRDFADIRREANALAAAGHRELIVTGVNIGTYADGSHNLADVIDMLCDIDGIDRVRISSIEPTTIDDRIIAQMARGDVLCPYLHIPLQSGDDGVLAAMRRRYTRDDYREYLESVIARVPGLGLGTDVIVGFPGEDEAAFEQSYQLIHDLPFTHLHVFSFSARPRTSAFNMTNQVEVTVIRDRSARMHRLGEMKKAEFYGSLVGTTQRVLFEERRDDGRWVGFTDNYVKVAVASTEDLANRLAEVEVSELEVPVENRPLHAIAELAQIEA